MKPTNKAIRVPFSLDQESYEEFKKQMESDYRKNRSEYLRYLIWKEHNERKNKREEDK